MTIVARLVSILLCLSAWLGSGLRAQQNPTATGECCPPRAVVIDSSVDAQVMADGVFTLVLDQVGLLNAGRDLAQSYLSEFRFPNFDDRRYRVFDPTPSTDFNPGGFVPGPGFYIFTWDGLNEACEESTSDDIVFTKPDTSEPPTWVDPGYLLCTCEDCCGITQSGGGGGSSGDEPSPTDAQFTPNSQLNPSGSNSALPGRPIVASSNRSGAQLWWHYPITQNAPLSVIEVRHWDGTVATYKRLPNVRVQRLDSSGSATREGDVWKLDKTTDPFDNVTQYTYDQRRQLVKVSYPNGIHAHWNWNPA